MTYNTRNCSNDTAESQNEKKNVLMLMQEEWECESRTLHAVQYKWQPGSVIMFCSYYFKNR